MSVPDSAPPPATPLAPLPYHREVVAYLKAAEPELWQWASSAEVKNEFAEEMRTGLLKANYRLDADGHPELLSDVPPLRRGWVSRRRSRSIRRPAASA